MSSPTPYIVALWISKDSENIDFKPLKEVASLVLSKHLVESSIEEISELSEQLFDDIIKELRNIQSGEEQDGVESMFELFDEEGTAYIRALESPAINIVRKLQSIESDEFEIFCKILLERLGGSSIKVGQRGDGGVDFIGYDFPLGRDIGPAPRNSRGIVIGQAKRYCPTELVKVGELREFIGGGVHKASELRKSISSIGVVTPIIYAFWTSSDFNKTAKEYARDMGIWYLNGLGLAQLGVRAGFKDELEIEKSITEEKSAVIQRGSLAT